MLDLTHLTKTAWERDYLTEVSTFLQPMKAIAVRWKSETLFHRFWPVIPANRVGGDLVIPPDVDEQTVLIILSDELYRIPGKIPALAVFKQYVAENDPVSIPFPLGIRSGFPALAPKPIAERPIDVGFVGCMYPHRRKLLKRLHDHPQLKGYHLALATRNTLMSRAMPNFLITQRFRYACPETRAPKLSAITNH